MSKHDDDWSPEEDDLVRSALLSLREDVDNLPLTPPATIKARGTKRKRTVWLASTAGLAAAGLVVAAVGLSGILRPDRDATDPASRSTTSLSSRPSATTSTGPSPSSGRVSLEELQALLGESQVLLPTAREWQAALDLPEAPTVHSGDVPALLCAMPVGAGVAVDAQAVTAAGAAAAFATQAVFRYPDEAAARAAATAMAAEVDDCRTPRETTLTPEHTDAYSEHPVMWSFTDSAGDTGWLTVTHRGRDVAYAAVRHPASSPGATTLDQFARVTYVIENRLERYGADAGGPPPSGGQGDAPDRHIAGPPGKVPQPRFFLDPRDFTATLFTADGSAEAGPGEFEGSPTVTLACDADTSPEGTFGLMRIKKAGVDASFFAVQRVREVFFGEADAAALVAAEVKRLTEGFTGCTAGEGQTTSTGEAGPSAGLFKVQTVYTDGTAPHVEYVAVTATTTPGYVSTIVLWTDAPEGVNDDDFWSELRRLSALAAKR